MNRKFSEQFSGQWVGIKFYEREPRLYGVDRPEGVRFCEAVKLAVTRPVLLNKENLACESAMYVFGWREKFDKKLLESCRSKCGMKDAVLQSFVASMPRLQKPFSHIGLNADSKPDLIMSSIAPQEMMELVKVYNQRTGKNMEVSLSSMMGLCGNIAVRTFLDQAVTISFGCADSRKYAEIERGRLVVGIPRRLFRLFV